MSLVLRGAVADPSQLFWITSRTAGIVAMLLASTSVAAGLLQSNRARMKTRVARDLRPIHEALSVATLVAVGVHGAALLGDTYIGFTPAQVLVPFTGGYQPLATAAGILAGWGLLLFGISYYLRARIGVSRWRLMHRAAALAWLLAAVHSLSIGTDAGELWFLAVAGPVALPAALLLLATWRERLQGQLSEGSSGIRATSA